jgi:hypothetical protein
MQRDRHCGRTSLQEGNGCGYPTMRNTLAESSEWKQYMLDVRKKVV